MFKILPLPVKCSWPTRSSSFEGRILSVGADAVIVSLDGSPEKLDDFTELLRQYGITESQRTGRVALPKLDTATKTTRALNTQGKAN